MDLGGFGCIWGGFDLDLINSLGELTVPVVCSGGAKNAEDFSKVFHEVCKFELTFGRTCIRPVGVGYLIPRWKDDMSHEVFRSA